ncbi:efflux RND transporter periplasmic adaptor subunit [Neptuniibacter sp. 2_MG-2023]|uniref:efflux RND transporter periplasmic adaptor subunit n=1 Tax=Neptuniibacter sp. 2_MG-2023 TaxID=3062671 RepID=UPI0026E15609|nr:efflux RND transporter periplasmic adaptor subunit [Neptuniibacter sp. 2_MG-2023]MDO6514490.1 efflux RND transporter periplasmic adaptor subunit [Neptuniibacter sp. 2_MG-2023]
MSASLFSPSWYRVSDLTVRLRKHAAIHRHIYRGKVWYVLQDHVTGQFQRFTPEAYQIIGLMDGRLTLQEIWDIACARLGDGMPTQDEIIQLVAQLNKANVIQSDILPDIEELQIRRRDDQNKKLLQQLKSPLSIRIPLLDPEPFLARTMKYLRPVYSWFGLVLWLVVIAIALTLAVINWDGLTDNVSDRILALENILLIALVYPFVKITHELGHAYAVKHWGGEVHEVGIMLLVMFPVPYVDASAASSFRNKYQRMLVGAAGILMELFLAGLAMIVWSLAEPGVVRAVAFNTMLIGGISTVLFNGNPLLRFDAYYVLADFIEIPNLGARGNAQVAYLVKHYLFSVPNLTPTANSRGEAAWLAGYAIAAYIYRLIVMVAIALFVASQYFIIGSLLAIWSIWLTLIMPIMKTVSKPITDPQLRNRRLRIFWVSAVIASAVVAGLFLLPVPYKTQVEGVLWVPQDAYVRTDIAGFVKSVEVQSGSYVEKGTLLITLDSPDLVAKASVLEAQVKEARIRLVSSLRDRSASDILREELRFIEREFERAKERLKGVNLYSTSSGEVIIPGASRLLGKYLNRGEMVGSVINYQNLPVTVLVSEDNIDLVRNQTRSIELRFVTSPEQSYAGEIIRLMPASTQEMPSSILSVDGGGKIAVDPQGGDRLKSFRGHFRMDISVPDAPKNRFDERVYVLFEHDSEPVFYRWYRAVRRVFLRQFDV